MSARLPFVVDDSPTDIAMVSAVMPLPRIEPAMPQLSVVIPVYNESGNLQPLICEIDATFRRRLRYEVIVVDDGSNDGTAAELAELLADHRRLRAVSHATNRGQSAAIRSGVKAALGPVVAVMDGDGQNDPADIPALFAALTISNSTTMAVGERRGRHDRWVRRASSRIANGVRSSLLGDGVKDTGCSVKVFYRDDFLDLPSFDHMHRFLPALAQQRGGKVRVIPVNHRARLHGRSKYGIRNRLWTGIVDLLGVMWLQRRRL